MAEAAFKNLIAVTPAVKHKAAGDVTQLQICQVNNIPHPYLQVLHDCMSLSFILFYKFFIS